MTALQVKFEKIYYVSQYLHIPVDKFMSDNYNMEANRGVGMNEAQKCRYRYTFDVRTLYKMIEK